MRKHRRKGGRITGAAFQAHSDVDTVVKYKETAIKALQLKLERCLEIFLEKVKISRFKV